jgi:hypothetical protein
MECVADFPTQVFRRQENAYRTIPLIHLEKRIPKDVHVIFFLKKARFTIRIRKYRLTK